MTSFEEIMGQEFDPGESALSSMGSEFYSLEPIIPNTEALLTKMDPFIVELAEVEKKEDEAKGKEVKEMMIDNFLRDLDKWWGVGIGEEVCVRNPSSIIVGAPQTKIRGVLINGKVELFGTYQCFGVGSWYDTPIGEVPEDDKPYLRKFGLLVVQQSVCMVDEVGEKEFLENNVRVPLHHGMPELFRVLR